MSLHKHLEGSCGHWYCSWCLYVVTSLGNISPVSWSLVRTSLMGVTTRKLISLALPQTVQSVFLELYPNFITQYVVCMVKDSYAPATWSIVTPFNCPGQVSILPPIPWVLLSWLLKIVMNQSLMHFPSSIMKHQFGWNPLLDGLLSSKHLSLPIRVSWVMSSWTHVLRK